MQYNSYLPLSKAPARLEYSNPYFRVYRQDVCFRGFSKEYYLAELGDRAAVLVVSQQRVLLVQQFRLLTDQISYEIPGGGIGPGEAPQEAAVRECLEETGVRCNHLEALTGFHLALETCHSFTHIYLCRDFLQESCRLPDAREIVAVQWIPFSTCLEMISSGKISDALTMIALLSYPRLGEVPPLDIENRMRRGGS